jgi:phosphoglycerate dehydrogenase-like enzyme/glyoxylase-like metal-dependent hydrolase (beta-lactamase superfamily II)
MRMTTRLGVLAYAGVLAAVYPAVAADKLPPMKFNDVKEVAPGVYFRYSAISPTDMSIFGGSNNIWVIFKDYVVVIDANFPKEAGDVIRAIRKTTDKPIRYVFDTHHHGDHSYGNAVFAKEGASIIAQTNCARLLRVNGPREFKEAGRGPGGRKDVAASKLKVPDVAFDDKLVLDDGKQRIEFRFFGHAHTSGDGSAYLPKHKLLCTGDACLNGAFNFMGHSDSASWIRALERMQQLDIRMVCPGHGPLAGKELLAKQKRYFVELRRQVRRGIDAGQDVEDILRAIDMPWYKDWTGVTPAGENVKHVYAEMTGRIMPWDLVEDFGIYEGPSPTKESSGWKEPKRIVVPQGLMPARLAELKRVAPQVLFIPAKNAEEAVKLVGEADAVLGFCTPKVIKAGKHLRWVQVGSAGVDPKVFSELKNGKVVLTDVRRVNGPQKADQAFALLLSLTRGLARAGHPQPRDNGTRHPNWDWLRKQVKPQELHGKTMLLVGLGGAGMQIARRARAFGMRVRAIDARDMDRPAFVFSLDKPTKVMELLPNADVVVLACSLTDGTRGLISEKQLAAIKKSAYLINVARGGLVKTADLIAALKRGQIAGAGLDVTDPEPLPEDHPLWKLETVVISPNTGDRSPEGKDRQWRLWRENVRRFVGGERLVCVVDFAASRER